MKNKKRGKVGMTLIELMVGVAIFGILVAIIIGLVGSCRNPCDGLWGRNDRRCTGYYLNHPTP